MFGVDQLVETLHDILADVSAAQTGKESQEATHHRAHEQTSKF